MWRATGASASALLEAGVREADLLIAVSENDEVNLICCLMAKKLGAKHTVARVRNPEYFRDAPILRREIGLDMIINPENAAAQEISRILRVPSAFSVETFASGLVELIGFQTEESDSLVGKSLIDYNRENPNSILMCAAKRGEEVIVPNGSFVPQTGDRVYVIGTPAETTRVLRSMGRAMAPIRRVSILGGSRIAQYLAWVLTDIGTHVTIVEKDEAKCLTLAEKLPKVTVIHGDGTNHDLLESEGIFHCDAFIAVTDRDEENLLMALTAKRYGVKKVVPKMSRMGYLDIVNLTASTRSSRPRPSLQARSQVTSAALPTRRAARWRACTISSVARSRRSNSPRRVPRTFSTGRSATCIFETACSLRPSCTTAGWRSRTAIPRSMRVTA